MTCGNKRLIFNVLYLKHFCDHGIDVLSRWRHHLERQQTKMVIRAKTDFLCKMRSVYELDF